MNGTNVPGGRDAARSGDTTAEEGTPVAVDTSIDRWASTAIVVLLAGPVIWICHFLLVYLVAEAGCSGAGAGLRFFDAPVPSVVTVGATAVATLGCLACAWWGYRRYQIGQREDAPHAEELASVLDLVGAALSLLFALSVLMVGLPALALPQC